METLATRSTTAEAERNPVAHWRRIVGAVVTALVVAVAASAIGAVVVIVVIAVLVVGAVAAAVDARSGRIPNRLVAAGALLVVAGSAAVTSTAGPMSGVVPPLLGAAAAAGPLLVAHLASPAAIGFGDVKLAAVMGAALGFVDPRLGLVALCVATGATALVGLATRRPQLPLGPGVALGTFAAVLLHGTVWT